MSPLQSYSTVSNFTPSAFNDGEGTSSPETSDAPAVNDGPDEERDSSAGEGYVKHFAFSM